MEDKSEGRREISYKQKLKRSDCYFLGHSALNRQRYLAVPLQSPWRRADVDRLPLTVTTH